MILDDVQKEMQNSMDHALEALKNHFTGLRTSRASANLLDQIKAEVYGSMVPIQQLASISVPEPRMLSVQVFDKNAVKPLERAIRESSLGLNPIVEGCMLRITLPELTQERRKELAKLAGKYTEESKISIRHARQVAINRVRDLCKEGEVTEDDQEWAKKEFQKLTDAAIEKAESLLEKKQADIMQL